MTGTPVESIGSRLGMASREVLEALLAHVADAVYLVDADGRIGFVNPAALALLGYEEDELLGRDAHATLHHHRWDGTPYPAADCPILQARVTGDTIRGYGDAFWRRDGTKFRIAFSSAALSTMHGAGAVVVFRDVTAQMRAEAHARHEAAGRARTEEIRASRSRLVQAADAERQRLVRDLHDGAQQRLVRILLELRLAAKALAGGEAPSALDARLEAIAQDTTTAIAELRDLASGFAPQILTTRGLAAAVESLTARLPLTVELSIGPRRFSDTTEAAAYFLIAEALTNVIKHAGAATASVTVVLDGHRRLLIRVTDDGCGGAQIDRGGGLAGMEDRLAALEGELRLHSSAGRGTELVAILPFSEVPASGSGGA